MWLVIVLTGSVFPGSVFTGDSRAFGQSASSDAKPPSAIPPSATPGATFGSPGATGNGASGAQPEGNSQPRPPSSMSAAGTMNPGEPGATEAAGSRNGTDPNSIRSPLDSLRPEVQYLPNANHELVPVFVDAKWEEFLEWVNRQRETAGPSLPPAMVSSIQLDGVADEQKAQLRVRLTVEVNRPSGPVAVPMGMGEAIPQSATYRGPGRSIFAGNERPAGLVWWLEGMGTHELELRVAVPLRKSGNWRQLAMALPASPVNTLRLSLAEALRPRVRAPDETLIEDQAGPDGTWELRASGFGELLDLSWQPAQPLVERAANLESNATFLVGGDPDQLFVEVQQVVRALQGAFREYTVRLPSRAQVLQVDGPELLETRIDPQNPERMTVVLNAPQTGQVSVRWLLGIPMGANRRQVLDGMLVESAKRQSGEIRLLASRGMVWKVPEPSDQNVARVNAGELRPSPGTSTTVRAYRFLSQPFRLTVLLEPVDPYVDLDPVFILQASPAEVQLDLRATVRMFRGRLDELRLRWPGWQTEGWSLQSVAGEADYIAGISSDESGVPGNLRLTFRQEAPDTFSFVLRARRAIRSQDAIPLTLPEPDVVSLSAARLLLVNSLEVESDLTARGETVLHPVRVATPLDWKALGYEVEPRFREYRLDTSERSFDLRVVPQSKQMKVTSHVDCRVIADQLQIEQSLQARVDYALIDSLDLRVPSRLAPFMTFRVNGERISPDWSADPGSSRTAKLRLPKPLTGAFGITASWSQPWLPDASAATTPIDIPLVQFVDAPPAAVKVQFPVVPWLQVTAADNGWSLSTDQGESRVWDGPAGSEVCRMAVTRAEPSRTAEFLSEQAVIRVVYDPQGWWQYRVQARVTGTAPELQVSIPGGPTSLECFWDGARIAPDSVLELPPGSGRYALRLPSTPTDSADERHFLTIDYRLAAPAWGRWWSDMELSVPEFPQIKWISQVLWVVGVPGNMHLFGEPTSAMPLHRWVRTSWYWSRQPLLDDVQLDRWMNSPEPEAWLPTIGNRYLLSQFGPPQRLVVRSLSSPAVLLLGGGSALLLGYLVLNISWFRWLPMLAVLAAGLAWLALVRRAEVELLLQPALLGSLFPVWSLVTEWIHRRRTMGQVLTIAAASELQFPQLDRDGSSLGPGMAGRSEPATVLRMPANPGSEATALRVTAESSSR
jgi:hypothetical protein